MALDAHPKPTTCFTCEKRKREKPFRWGSHCGSRNSEPFDLDFVPVSLDRRVGLLFDLQSRRAAHAHVLQTFVDSQRARNMTRISNGHSQKFVQSRQNRTAVSVALRSTWDRIRLSTCLTNLISELTHTQQQPVRRPSFLPCRTAPLPPSSFSAPPRPRHRNPVAPTLPASASALWYRKISSQQHLLLRRR